MTDIEAAVELATRIRELGMVGTAHTELVGVPEVWQLAQAVIDLAEETYSCLCAMDGERNIGRERYELMEQLHRALGRK